MIRYISSASIFLLLVICVFYVHNLTENITFSVTACIDSEILNAEAESYNGDPILEAQKIWDDRRSFFSAVIPHDKLDSIDAQFAICNSWASSEENDEYLAALWELRSMINVISELDSPSPDRII